jgi:hypothetical protein
MAHKHTTNVEFWHHFKQLPISVQSLARKNFGLLKGDPRHPSLRFKKVGEYWSVRVGLDYRALARERDGQMVWFWIGSHDAYERRLK